MNFKTIAFLLSAFFVTPLLWAQDKPNMVVIMTDNLGYGDLGAYGGLRAPTPRIDKLASEGVLFQDFQVEPKPALAPFDLHLEPLLADASHVLPGIVALEERPAESNPAAIKPNGR